MNTLFTCYRCKGHFDGDHAFDEHVRFSGCYASKPTKQAFSVRALAPDGVTHILEVRNVHTEGEVTVVETFLSALPPPGRGMVPLTDWQPIETAPKDGTEILLASRGDMGVCYWRDDNVMTGWTWGLGHRFNWATHWMPLPKAPAATPAPSAQEGA